jgi:NCS1 family nucleobase:cation symporter-1
MSENLEIKHIDPSVYSEDLAPLKQNRRWGALGIFNVWANDVQSLSG